MEAKLKSRLDRKADILHIDKCRPCREQDLEELPVTGDLRLTGTGKT